MLIVNRASIFSIFPCQHIALSVAENYLAFFLARYKDLLPAEDLVRLWSMLLLVFLLVSILSRCWKCKRYNAELWVVLTIATAPEWIYSAAPLHSIC